MFNCFGDFLYLSPQRNLRMVLRDKKHEELKRVTGQGGLGESKRVCVCVLLKETEFWLIYGKIVYGKISCFGTLAMVAWVKTRISTWVRLQAV